MIFVYFENIMQNFEALTENYIHYFESLDGFDGNSLDKLISE